MLGNWLVTYRHLRHRDAGSLDSGREAETFRICRWLRYGVRDREVSRPTPSVALGAEDLHSLRRGFGGSRAGGRGGGQPGASRGSVTVSWIYRPVVLENGLDAARACGPLLRDGEAVWVASSWRE